MTVTVEPDEARGPGHALIRVSGAAGVAANAGFRIARDPDWPEPNLGPAGWQGAETVLTPDGALPEGGDLVLSVGPAVCDRLEEGMFLFALPVAGVSTAVMWPQIEAVHAGSGTTFALGGRTAATGSVPAKAAASLAVPPVVPVSTGTTAPPPVSSTPPIVPVGRSRWPLAVATLVLLAVAAGGGAWWWLHRPVAAPPEQQPAAAAPPAQPPQPTPVPAPPSAPVPAPTPPPTPALVDPNAMSVRDLVARSNNADMLDQARKRLTTKPGEALLLLETAGEDRHDGASLALLAQLYDPNKPRQGGIAADARTAAKDYRDAERNGDHSAAADREALHRTLIAARDNGDNGAKLIEGDFWP